VLIADEGNNRAIEVTHVIGSASTIVASFTASPYFSQLGRRGMKCVQVGELRDGFAGRCCS